jgi:hypothetical protein
VVAPVAAAAPAAVAGGATKAVAGGTAKAVAKGAEAAGKTAGKAAGGVAKKGAKSVGKGVGGATRSASKSATKGATNRAGQSAGNAAMRASRPASAPARPGRAGPGRGSPPNRPGPGAAGSRGPTARDGRNGRVGNGKGRGGLPESPLKQARRAVNRANDARGRGQDDRQRRRRGVTAAPGDRARKELASQLRGGRPREQDGAEEAAEAAVRGVGRRSKRLLFLDRDQFFRRTVRRSLIVLVMVLFLLAYPAMTIWASTATDHEPEAVVDDGLLNAMSSLGGGPIPEALIPVVAEATGIPLDALRAYSSAAGSPDWPIDWRIMAAIGKVECDHGRSPALYCSTPHNVWNTAGGSGERGPMQHLGHLWRVGENDPFDPRVEGPPTPVNKDSTHVATDGSGDGIADPWNWYDATHSAARKLTLYREELKAKGAAYDTDDFMIAAYNAGVAGATRNGSNIATIPNKGYLDKVTAERDRILVATAPLGFVGGNAACPVVAPRGTTSPLNPPHVTPATATMANNTVGCFGREYTVGCYSPRDGTFEHPRGRACDFMITPGGPMPDTARRVHGTAMAEWHMNNAGNFNLLYVIWYGKIWDARRDRTPKPWSQWRTYVTGGIPCSTPSACGVTRGHYDHVHVSVKLMPGDPGYAHCPHDSCSE